MLRDLVLETPPNVTAGGWLEALPELARGARWADGSPSSTWRCAASCSDLFVKSAGDYLDSWFESAPIKAAYGFDGIVGNYASPYAAGSAYVLLHHVFGEVNGKKGVWGHAIGGMGAITQAMAKAAAERGVEIRTSSPVREVIVESGRAVGVVTEHGETLRARCVVSNLNPKLLYERLIDPAALDAGLSRAHAPLALRIGHFPHERRAVGAAGFYRVCRAAAWASITPPASSWRPASATWIGPISTPKPAAGRSAPSSRC